MGEDGARRLTDAEAEEAMARLDGLLEAVEGLDGDPGELARRAVAALAGVYGEALARTLAAAGPAARDRLGSDPLVATLMVLHELRLPPTVDGSTPSAAVGDGGDGDAPAPTDAFIPLGSVRVRSRA